jgi:hypothetical protein
MPIKDFLLPLVGQPRAVEPTAAVAAFDEPARSGLPRMRCRSR